MNIAIIGAGYVGLASAACFGELGHRVFVVDISSEKIAMLRRGKIPFHEEGLQKLISKLVKAERIIPETSYAKALQDAEIAIICVGTPPKKNGEADLSQVFSAAEKIAAQIKDGGSQLKVVVTKSTVPVGTGDRIKKLFNTCERAPRASLYKKNWQELTIASCPEFLREGSALHDVLNPSRIVIGADSSKARKLLLSLHKKLPGKRVLTSLRTAELIKYASNAFLATKISFINEIANLCEGTGANVEDVALGMGLDPRIGPGFLKAGIGYGGSCFPKDTHALRSMALAHDYDFKLLKAVIEVNRAQRTNFLKKVKQALGGSIGGKRIGVLGLAFKAGTDDVRESAALEICENLLKQGAKITAYDPKAAENAKRVLPKLKICAKPEDAAKSADCVCVLTEWPEFTKLDWGKMGLVMRRKVVVDGRNLLNIEKMKRLGFSYSSVGRKPVRS